MRREPQLRRGRAPGARARARARRCSSTTITYTWRRASFASTPRRRRCTHFVHVPWPQPDYWRVLPEAIRRALHEGILASDVVSFHTDRWRRSFLRSCEDILGAESDHESGIVRFAGRELYACVARSRSTRAEFDALAASETCRSRRSARSSQPAGIPRRARRPHRSVEERRARLPRIRAVPRGASRAAWSCRDARAARPVAPGHPGVRGVSRCDPAGSAGSQRPVPATTVGCPRPPDPGQLPAGRRRLQAVRRPARERDLRRHEPRCEGGAAGQRARRRADPLGEHRRPRGAGALGAHGQSVRRRRRRPRRSTRPSRCRGKSAAVGIEGIRGHVAATTLPDGSKCCSPTSTRPSRRAEVRFS